MIRRRQYAPEEQPQDMWSPQPPSHGLPQQPQYIGLLLDDEELAKKLKRVNWAKRVDDYIMKTLSLQVFLSLFVRCHFHHNNSVPDRLLLQSIQSRILLSSLPAPLTGVLSSNNLLQSAVRIAYNEINGPNSFVLEGDDLYVATSNGMIVLIRDEKVVDSIYVVEACKSEEGLEGERKGPITEKDATDSSCGRLTSLRRLDSSLLLVVDAIRGLFTVNFSTRKVESLLPSPVQIDRSTSLYFHDAVVVDESRIVISERSSHHPAEVAEYERMEHRPNGKLILFERNRNYVTVLQDGLFEPSGLEVLPDRDTILVAETGTGSIISFPLSTRRVHSWNRHLPGLPSMIRLTANKQSVWVGFEETRIHEQGSTTSIVEYLGKWPFLRKGLLALLPFGSWRSLFNSFLPPHAIAVKYDLQGNALASIQAPHGIEKKGSVLEVHENDDSVFAVARQGNYVMRLERWNVVRVGKQNSGI